MVLVITKLPGLHNLFLHKLKREGMHDVITLQDDIKKHEIAGLQADGNCNRGSHQHRHTFDERPPCPRSLPPTRESLSACLPVMSSPCKRFLPPLDLSVSR